MKLNPTNIRYLSNDEFRVLTATEMGTRNHEIVPTCLISHIADLKHGGVHKILSSLAKQNLIAREQNAKYDGYRLTYGGFDFLALKTMSKRDSIYSVGNQIGVGKESDILLVADQDSVQYCLKIHRLGRISFRTIKANRDYLRNKHSSNWMYMARLAATKEFAFLTILYDNGFPVPKPIDHNRHCIVMELMDAYPLNQIQEVSDPGALYSKLMNLIVKLACSGLIHGDFNEFNLLIDANDDPILIDFPQMVSTKHRNAEEYFNRDVNCIRSFFRKRFQYESKLYPRLTRDVVTQVRLDVQGMASGFSKKEIVDIEKLQDSLLNNQQDTDNEEAEDESEDESENDHEDDLENDHEAVDIPKDSLLENTINQLNISKIDLNNSDNESEQDQELEENENKTHRPHRDIREEDEEISPTHDQDEIKKRILKSFKKPLKSNSRNFTKGRGKRNLREQAKSGASGFWA